MADSSQGGGYNTFEQSFSDIDDEDSKRNVMILSSSPRSFTEKKSQNVDIPDLNEFERNKKAKRIEIATKVYNYSCLGLSALTTGVLCVLCIVFAAVFQNLVHYPTCDSVCHFELAESIPTNMTLGHEGLSLETYSSLVDLFDNARHSIKIMAFYFTLNNTAEAWARGEYGNAVYSSLLGAKKRGVHISIVYDGEMYGEYPHDINVFKHLGIELHKFNFTHKFGRGIQHAKFAVVDGSRFYVGSANMDWRSLSQVMELGIVVRNCACLARDLEKVFDIFVDYLATGVVDYDFDTKVNLHNPMRVDFNDSSTSTGRVFFSASPPKLNSAGRTPDFAAMENVLLTAEEVVDMSVMSFEPFYNEREYWDELDSVVKSLLFKNVSVRVLVSLWNHTSEFQKVYIKTLSEFGKLCKNAPHSKYCLGEIQVKQFVVPDFPQAYPFTRVNHGKYVVTDKKVFISTSNWMKQYFEDNGGVSMIATTAHIVENLRAIFERNWNSEYAHDV